MCKYNRDQTRCSMHLRLIPSSCLIMFLSTHQCKSGISPRIKNRLYPIFPGKSLVFHHFAHFGRSDYATNGLHSALPSSSGDINGWFHYSHSTKLTPQITTRGPLWKGLWGPRCELCLLIDTGGYHFSWFLLPFGPGFLPAYSNNKKREQTLTAPINEGRAEPVVSKIRVHKGVFCRCSIAALKHM